MRGAYYNEHEPYAAEWLRNLIKQGLIADGEVDERSIVDVHADDLRGFTQCHFFAGIGGWSHALRLAGWSDDRPVWTGSCPCQPFSVAGKGLGADDPRHLWPHFHRLIATCRPPVVFGEQVSGAAGYSWLDGVRSDLAGENYACEAFDIPACAVDAPHIRSRLYWVAQAVDDAAGARRAGDARPEQVGAARDEARRAGLTGRSGDGRSNMADAAHGGWREERADAGRRGAGDRAEGRAAGFDAGRLDDANDARLEGHARHGADGSGWARAAGSATATGGGDMADASRITEREPHDDERAIARQDARASAGGRRGGYASAANSDMADADIADGWDGRVQRGGQLCGAGGDPQARARNGTYWSDAIWLTGADGKSRRAEPGISLLAHGIPARVGRLRAYGNAIVPQLAAEVIGAFMDVRT